MLRASAVGLLIFCNIGSFMSNDVLSIEQATRITQKEKLKDWVGKLTAGAMPSRARQLYRTPSLDPERLAEKAIMFHLRRRAISENRTGFLERIHKAFWSGGDGAQYASNCDHRFNDLFLVRQREDFEALAKAWQQFAGNQIVEIGANSGLLLDYLTKHLAGVTRSVGIDINQEQIQCNQASALFDPRLRFLCADGRKWVLNNEFEKTLFVTNGGVLEYFPHTKLQELLRHISDNCKPAIFYASEPVAADHDWNQNVDSMPFGEEHSFSHNYSDLFESHGFEILHQRAIDYEAWRMVATVAVTKT